MRSLLTVLSILSAWSLGAVAQSEVGTSQCATQVAVLCYHRFEEKPRDGLAITPARFEQEMQALKDSGIEVISMEDFLAWQRGEKSLPERCAMITIYDGYVSAYREAWPILTKFGYPFTVFVYTDYIKGGPKSGGGSISWEQLAEMRDAGVEIGSHTVSHSSLTATKGRSEDEYVAWLRHELIGSKEIIERELGVKVRTIAYPYGHHNEAVRRIAKEAGYEAAFSVKGSFISRGGDAMAYGRTAIDSTKPDIFARALAFPGAMIADSGDAGLPGAAMNFPTTPPDGELADSELPEISIDLSSVGQIDPSSIVMQISGIGQVPAEFDAATGKVSYKLGQRLYANPVRVALSARAAGKRLAATWSFSPATPWKSVETQTSP